MTHTKWIPKLSREQMEQRRLKAGEMFEQGYNQNQASKILGVNRCSTCRWYERWEKKGPESLKRRKNKVSRKKLNNEQIRELERILLAGASSYGYDTDLWTLKRISYVIQKEFRISYHPSSLSRTLRFLGYSCQKPVKMAANRNEEERQAWIKTVWEDDKKK